MLDKYIERQWAKHIAKMEQLKAQQKENIIWLMNQRP